MLAIYGHKWQSHLGHASDDAGRLSDAALTWQRGLAGISLDQIRNGFDTLIIKQLEWPPSLPEFRALCLSGSHSDYPTLDEVIAVLVRVAGSTGSLVDRYRHSLIFAIAQDTSTDMHALRTGKLVDVKRILKPIYEKLITVGWKEWPEHAHAQQQALSRDKPIRDKALALSSIAEIRQTTHG